jgi:hypothetical protein
MRRLIVAVSALVTLCLALPAAMANPAPPREIPGLGDALRYAIEHGPQHDCGELSVLLARSRPGRLRTETLDLIGRNMRVLEPCIVEAVRLADWVDQYLQDEFQTYASAEGKASMCAVLRERLITRWAEGGATDRSISELLYLADLLSDYQDQAARPVLSTLIDELRGLPADTLSTGLEETVSAFLIGARNRIDGPEVGQVMYRDRKGRGRFLRSASEVVECRLRRIGALDSDWHSLFIGPGTIGSYFRLIETSPLAKGGARSSDLLAMLRMCFRDGLSATMFVYSSGRVYCDDDYRRGDSPVMVRSQKLADSILDWALSVSPDPPLGSIACPQGQAPNANSGGRR